MPYWQNHSFILHSNSLKGWILFIVVIIIVTLSIIIMYNTFCSVFQIIPQLFINFEILYESLQYPKMLIWYILTVLNSHLSVIAFVGFYIFQIITLLLLIKGTSWHGPLIAVYYLTILI